VHLGAWLRLFEDPKEGITACVMLQTGKGVGGLGGQVVLCFLVLGCATRGIREGEREGERGGYGKGGSATVNRAGNMFRAWHALVEAHSRQYRVVHIAAFVSAPSNSSSNNNNKTYLVFHSLPSLSPRPLRGSPTSSLCTPRLCARPAKTN
jgi:hypothetical protein